MLFQTEVAVLLMLLKMELTEDFRPLKALVTVLFMPFTTEDTVPLMEFQMELTVSSKLLKVLLKHLVKMLRPP